MSKRVYFYLVRHGQTLFNVKGIMQGWCDSPLTKKGIEQAHALQLGFKDIMLDAAFSSTSERAHDTGEIIIQGHGLKLHSSKAFREMNFGTIEGDHESTMPYEMHVKRFFEGYPEFGGETNEELNKRLIDKLNDIAKKSNDGSSILIATHGSAIMHLYDYITGDLHRFISEHDNKPFDNCTVMKLEYIDGKYIVLSYNDTSYRDNGYKLLKEKENGQK